MRKVSMKTKSFLSSEPAMVMKEVPEFMNDLHLNGSEEIDKILESNPSAAPAVVISFGGMSGPVSDFLISVEDARELIMQTTASLATLGDPVAQAIGEQYFRAT